MVRVYRASDVAHQVLKQRIFPLAELDWFARAFNHMALRIKHQVSYDEVSEVS